MNECIRWVKGALWRIWLRHSAESWKMSGSIPDVIGVFH
jgi:hypothetical protein